MAIKNSPGKFFKQTKSRKLNKKGIFFTFIAIGLVSLLVYSFAINTGYIYRNSMFVIETRVNTINKFIKDVDTDIDRGFYISSFRSMLAIGDFITANNTFMPDIDAAFEEALINSTIMNESHSLLTGASFIDWTEKIKDEASKIDIIIDFIISNITLNQSGPWKVNAEMDIAYNITDKKQTASWMKSNHIGIELSIIGLEDPIYSLNTYGKIINKITQANETNFNDFDVLKNHISNSYYIASEQGPSFLMRLEGNFSNSTDGIESIVNLKELEIQGLSIKTASAVDYIYFSNESISSCMINETINETASYNWFRLDDSDSYHLNKYDVECI